METSKNSTSTIVTTDAEFPFANPKPHQTIEHVTIINAAIETVWESLIDIKDWRWNKWFRIDVSEDPVAGLKGTLRGCWEGNDKDWKTYPFEFTEVNPEEYILAWKGTAPCCFFAAYHTMRLEKIDETKTKLIHHEDFGGCLPIFGLGLPYRKADHNHWLTNEAFKKYVEENSSKKK